MGATEVPVEVRRIDEDDVPTSWNPVKVFFLMVVLYTLSCFQR